MFLIHKGLVHSAIHFTTWSAEHSTLYSSISHRPFSFSMSGPCLHSLPWVRWLEAFHKRKYAIDCSRPLLALCITNCIGRWIRETADSRLYHSIALVLWMRLLGIDPVILPPQMHSTWNKHCKELDSHHTIMLTSHQDLSIIPIFQWDK